MPLRQRLQNKQQGAVRGTACAVRDRLWAKFPQGERLQRLVKNECWPACAWHLVKLVGPRAPAICCAQHRDHQRSTTGLMHVGKGLALCCALGPSSAGLFRGIRGFAAIDGGVDQTATSTICTNAYITGHPKESRHASGRTDIQGFSLSYQ